MPYWDFGANAAWRSCRYSSMKLLSMMAQSRVPLSPLFSAPVCTLSMIMIDCLHTLDLGISQDTLGNLFHVYLLSGLCRGGNRADKVNYLQQKNKVYYAQVRPPTRISNLTPDMIRRPGKSPKFRGKGQRPGIWFPMAFYWLKSFWNLMIAFCIVMCTR